MSKKGKWPGTWAVICQSCGFRFPSNEIKQRWDGLLVCDKDFEPRHPQTLIRIPTETAVPTFVSKPEDVYVEVTYIDDPSIYGNGHGS